MVRQAMGARWTTYGVELYCFVLLFFGLGIRGCCSLGSEGFILLKFRSRVECDPFGTFSNWNCDDQDPCGWSGVHCVDGTVSMLDLSGLCLEGRLAPELGKLTHLRSLVLSDNCFSGSIPKEFGGLTMLEVMDLRNNNLTGTIPSEIGGIQSLKRLLLHSNRFEGSVPLELRKRRLLSELQFDENLTSAVAPRIGINRKFGYCVPQIGLKSLWKVNSFIGAVKRKMIRYADHVQQFNFGKASYRSHAPGVSSGPHMALLGQNLASNGRRKLVEQSSNLAAPGGGGGSAHDQVIALPSSRSSGSFPAVLKAIPPVPAPVPPPSYPISSTPSPAVQPSVSDGKTSKREVKYVAGALFAAFFLIVAASVFFVFRKQAAKTIPWKTGLSGQLQKAFVTGVPKLNRSELETACEDFSNIIHNFNGGTVYKGTLSSGVEIAVTSTIISSFKEWSKRAEMAYRKKIDTLSRVNHKNFVNLIGYCVEDAPFVRMMVFEYAPNGSLFEHLHVEEMEHLDWSTRMRVIMGVAYCLQYMHGLTPPVSHSNLNSEAVLLTDDYAAKIGEIDFWAEFSAKSKISGETGSQHSDLPPLADPETNVYSFGVLLLEIISGKLAYSEEHGSLVDWASPYLNDWRNISHLVDPTLKFFKHHELDVLCDVIQECIEQDSRMRPSMKEITSKLREVLDISPEAAVPRLSPLWWAELEILSAEAA